MFKTIGTLRYSPQSRGNKDSKWWVIVDCDPGIGELYRTLFKQAFFSGQLGVEWTGKALVRPAWKEHVSVIRNEEPPEEFKPVWGLDEGREFVLECDPILKGDGLYLCLSVKCDSLLDLREKLGLPREPFYPLHLSVANTKS